MMAKKRTRCETCCTSLGSQNALPETKFLAHKDRGGLFKPSKSVIAICEETEKCFRRMIASTSGNLPRKAGVDRAISTAVLGNLSFQRCDIFPELFDHMLECSIDDNHVFNLIKLIAQMYRKIRFYHQGKVESQKYGEPKIRKILSKLILFQHQ